MAREMKIVLTDDFDGTTAAETLRFGLDQGNYEIELSSANAAKLREALAPFVERARRVQGNGTTARRQPRASGIKTKGDTPKIRAWAQARGKKVSDRGRIHADIVSEYYAEQNQS